MLVLKAAVSTTKVQCLCELTRSVGHQQQMYELYLPAAVTFHGFANPSLCRQIFKTKFGLGIRFLGVLKHVKFHCSCFRDYNFVQGQNLHFSLAYRSLIKIMHTIKPSV